MTSAQIRSLKTRPISPAMIELLGMIDSFTGSVTAEQLEPDGLRVWFFHNDYPTFTDTNNLSLLTFLDVGGVAFVLGGDLELAGWLTLLENPHVQGLLKRVDVFVASHHGRQSGYCPEVFSYCKPRLVVMSDGPIQHDTQLMASTYAQHASGELFSTPSGQETRKVVHEEGREHLLESVAGLPALDQFTQESDHAGPCWRGQSQPLAGSPHPDRLHKGTVAHSAITTWDDLMQKGT